MISPHGPIESKELSDAQRIKRMCSGPLDTNTLNDVAAIGYITTAITVTSVQVYAIAAVVGVGLVLDVGIEGDDDAVVAVEALGALTIDTVSGCTIDTPNVAAGHMLTTSIHTADGTSGTIQVAIEYYENE